MPQLERSDTEAVEFLKETLEIGVYTKIRVAHGKRNPFKHAFLGRIRISILCSGETEGVVLRGQQEMQWRHLEKRGWFSHISGRLGYVGSLFLVSTHSALLQPPASFLPDTICSQSMAAETAMIICFQTLTPSRFSVPFPSCCSIRICYFEVKNPALFSDATMVSALSDDVLDEEQQDSLWEASPLRLGTAAAAPTPYDLVTKVEYIFVHVVRARSLPAMHELGGTSDPVRLPLLFLRKIRVQARVFPMRILECVLAEFAHANRQAFEKQAFSHRRSYKVEGIGGSCPLESQYSLSCACLVLYGLLTVHSVA